MKRATGVLCLFLLLFCSSGPALSSRLLPMDGSWKVTGKATVGASVPGLIHLNATFLKNREITDTFTFHEGMLYSKALGPVGPYSSDSPDIDIDGLVETLRETIAAQLPEGSALTFATKTCNMRANTATSSAGTLVLVLNARNATGKETGIKSATFTVSCTFAGEKQMGDTLPVQQTSDAMNVIAAYLAKKAINPALALMDSGSLQNSLRNAVGYK